MVLPPVKMFDASVPPASAPAGYRAVAGYIGGDTPHVWTKAEWRRFDQLPKLPIWVRHSVMRWAGFYAWVYGSASTVFGNPSADGYWVADYAGIGPFLYPHRFVKATQYDNGPNYDSSLVKHWQYDWRLWE